MKFANLVPVLSINDVETSIAPARLRLRKSHGPPPVIPCAPCGECFLPPCGAPACPGAVIIELTEFLVG